MDKPNSFIMYRSFVEALRKLNSDQLYETFFAIADYALDGIEPVQNQLEPISGVVYELVKPQLDANRRKRENGAKGAEFGYKGAEFGKRGGRPKTKNDPEYREKAEDFIKRVAMGEE